MPICALKSGGGKDERLRAFRLMRRWTGLAMVVALMNLDGEGRYHYE